ncbi:MAG: hypothetical protein BGN87_04630 [Rhizobiales bacterium 65-79]|jgi:hypothetical protein|nr:MAG: hypothetical protein BGN87_04630 [Rhizobiales bacterium 65-79]
MSVIRQARACPEDLPRLPVVAMALVLLERPQFHRPEQILRTSPMMTRCGYADHPNSFKPYAVAPRTPPPALGRTLPWQGRESRRGAF